MRILILAPYPEQIAPSQRFRFEQYLQVLRNRGWTYDYRPFIDLPTWQILHKPGRFLQKGWGMLRAFGRRAALMSQLGGYDYVLIHREASHVGPPVFEWMMARLLGKKLVYDFDDAIWLPNYSEHNARFHWLKWYHKVPSVIRWSHRVSAGNAYLARYAGQYNPRVQVNPTTIDTEHYHNPALFAPSPRPAKPVIGWTGTLTTAKYLDALVPVLQRLEQEFDFELRVICNQRPDLPLRSMVFMPWRKETEIADLMSFDLGLMPLERDAWAEGKCGFKALQYMALGVPALVSPIGVNTDIVTHGQDGFVCDTPQQWEQALRQLLQDRALRERMGRQARETVQQRYSVRSNTENFLSLFS